jgi:hypothetical protein
MKDNNNNDIAFSMGKAELHLKNLNEFINLINYNTNFEGFIFRGQERSSYKLLSSFERRIDDLTYHDELITQHMARFKNAIRGRSNLTEEENKNDLEIFAIGQHWGLFTPLLDWSAIPLVALYFAYCEKRYLNVEYDTDVNLKQKIRKEMKKIDEDRAVFVLNAKRINEMVDILAIIRLENEIKKTKNEELEKVLFALGISKKISTANISIENKAILGQLLREKIDWMPTGIKEIIKNIQTNAKGELGIEIFSPKSGSNGRLVNQRGLFTLCYKERDVEKAISSLYLPESLSGNNILGKEELLLKITMPNSESNSILQSLESMNINHLSLFPDLIGSSIYCNNKFIQKKNKL